MIAQRMAEGNYSGLAYHVGSCDPDYLVKLIQAEPRLIHMLLQNNQMSDLDVKIVENVLTGLLGPLVPGQAQYPGQDKMICGLEQLRIIGMLQLARKLPFVISGIRNYELG
jgi:hypothetical protein